MANSSSSGSRSDGQGIGASVVAGPTCQAPASASRRPPPRAASARTWRRSAGPAGRPVACAPMALDPRTPVIIGVGQVVQRADGPRRRPRAARSSWPRQSARRRPTPGWPTCPRPTRSGSSTCCRGATATRRGCVAEELGLDAARDRLHDGRRQHAPAAGEHRRRARSRRAELDLAILTGGEAWRTRMRARRSRRRPDVAEAARGHRARPGCSAATSP